MSSMRPHGSMRQSDGVTTGGVRWEARGFMRKMLAAGAVGVGLGTVLAGCAGAPTFESAREACNVETPVSDFRGISLLKFSLVEATRDPSPDTVEDVMCVLNELEAPKQMVADLKAGIRAAPQSQGGYKWETFEASWHTGQSIGVSVYIQKVE